MLISIIGVVWCFNVYFNKAVVHVTIDSNASGEFQIYWAAKNQGYSEKRSALARFRSNIQRISFKLTDLKNVERIRVDPIRLPALVTLYDLMIEQNWFVPIRFNSIETFQQLKPLNHIQDINYYPNAMTIHVSGNDPQMEIYLEPQMSYLKYAVVALVILATGILLNIVIYSFSCIFILLKEHNMVLHFFIEGFFFVACVFLFLIYADHQFKHTISFIKELFLLYFPK